ncbi:LysR family transcriptional regulator [Comamonadaceae bacterium G21597-S1]|nr:LysR family transcriptional regulator [Comamonadaceae bacterium G21597-S1]
MNSSRQLVRLHALDLNQLVPLASLLRFAGVTDAAHALDMSQPAMSKHLERLRRTFEDALLVREGNRMILTPKGQELLPLVDAALERVDQVFATHGAFDPSAASRNVRIGANDYLQQLLAPPLQTVLRTQAPRLILEFGPVGMLQPGHLLSQGIVDLMIGLTQANAELRSVQLYEDAFVCIACSGNRALPDVLDVDTFSAQPHLDVSPSGAGLLRAVLDKALAAQGGQRRLAASISTFLGVPGMLVGTDMLALVPRRALESMPRDALRVFALDFTLEPFAVSLWWHNRTHNDPLNRWLREQIVHVAASL